MSTCRHCQLPISAYRVFKSPDFYQCRKPEMALERSGLCFLAFLLLSFDAGHGQHSKEQRGSLSPQQRGKVSMESLMMAWQMREVEIEEFYSKHPDDDSEPDPHSDLQIYFEKLKRAVEESDQHFLPTLKRMEGHHVTCRKEWQKRLVEKQGWVTTHLATDQSSKLGLDWNSLGLGAATLEKTERLESNKVRRKRQTGNGEGDPARVNIDMITENLKARTIWLVNEVTIIVKKTLEEVSDEAEETFVRLYENINMSTPFTTTSRPTTPSSTSWPRTSPATPMTPATPHTPRTSPATPHTPRTSPATPMTPATPRTPRTSPATPMTPATPRTPRTSPATPMTPATPRTPRTSPATPMTPATPRTPRTSPATPMTPATPRTPRTSPATPMTPATPRTPRTSPATPKTPATPSTPHQELVRQHL
ncbi:hypothetical protein RRG08_034694 [Elysia crispata]|uniref:Uncharacterized protein n=1 Tax=Elysia crispata TaxID=231223 RepID=A0AAE0Z162_9GAST|nr:hypothetical protein RRG08_034694 [Elysia crispata]